MPYKPHGTHDYTAKWVSGRGIVVTDPAGNEVNVHYSGTKDGWTMCAIVQGVGFIGGWEAGVGKKPTRRLAPTFPDLVASINSGRLYNHSDDLPISYGRRPTRRW